MALTRELRIASKENHRPITDDTRTRDRLCERIVERGADSLESEEILEFILSFSLPQIDVNSASRLLLTEFGSLGGVLNADQSRLVAMMVGLDPRGTKEHRRSLLMTEGLLKAVRACSTRVLREEFEDRPVIGSWTALIDYLQVALAHEPIEQFRLLFLDRKNILIRDEVQQRGTVDHTPVYPREIVKRALELQASAIIMVHNHPAGDPTPSRGDIEMTKQVIQALGAVGITLHDHVIIGKNRHTSFKTQRLI